MLNHERNLFDCGETSKSLRTERRDEASLVSEVLSDSNWDGSQKATNFPITAGF